MRALVSIALVSIALAALALSGATLATSPFREHRQKAVTLADLDLEKSADTGKLQRRIREAAREVCYTPGLLAVMRASYMRQCALETARHAAEDAKTLVR